MWVGGFLTQQLQKYARRVEDDQTSQNCVQVSGRPTTVQNSWRRIVLFYILVKLAIVIFRILEYNLQQTIVPIYLLFHIEQCVGLHQFSTFQNINYVHKVKSLHIYGSGVLVLKGDVQRIFGDKVQQDGIVGQGQGYETSLYYQAQQEVEGQLSMQLNLPRQKFGWLQSLSLVGCQAKSLDVKIELIDSLRMHSNTLQSLRLLFSNKKQLMSEDHALQLLKVCSKLTFLDIANICHIENKFVQKVEKYCPSIVQLCLDARNFVNTAHINQDLLLLASLQKLYFVIVKNLERVGITQKSTSAEIRNHF
eukprot:TRINITY_DN6608_c0_g1_i1.p2 TRINITY_DN6608_c0_g1~~TRINITY_DN6608_c0_g1_i1.p2  ORF type:complete len:307 (-),score=5.16 TRINITY_DN6608_c0_g1_i1:634-1554(-)